MDVEEEKMKPAPKKKADPKASEKKSPGGGGFRPDRGLPGRGFRPSLFNNFLNSDSLLTSSSLLNNGNSILTNSSL